MSDYLSLKDFRVFSHFTANGFQRHFPIFKLYGYQVPESNLAGKADLAINWGVNFLIWAGIEINTAVPS